MLKEDKEYFACSECYGVRSLKDTDDYDGRVWCEKCDDWVRAFFTTGKKLNELRKEKK